MITAQITAFRAPVFARIQSTCSALGSPLRTPSLPKTHRHRLQRSFTSTPVRAMSSMQDMILTKNKENPVMVYSKTYCPYCSEVKGLFKQLNVPAKVVELDELADGGNVQDALSQVTGRSTVPQVFIGGKHVGGCDDTMAAYRSGQLKTLLADVGFTI